MRTRRLPVVMLSTLLLAIVVLSAFTVQLLAAQRYALEDAVRESRAQALSALAVRLEQALLDAVRPAFLVFKNVPYEAGAPDFSRLHELVPELEQVLFLDKHLALRHSLPNPSGRNDRLLDHWLAKRVALEFTDPNAETTHTFVESFQNRPTLFALQPANEVNPAAGWLLMRFDLRDLQRNRIAPLFAAFTSEQGGTLELQDPQAPWDDNALNLPVGNVLPGWLLAYYPDRGAQERQIRRGTALILGELGGAVLAFVIAVFALWREIRREQAMVELRNRFVANVSHELKTPLALIRMYAETLFLRRITDPERQHQYHRTILRESERLSEMIEAVLDFGRLNQKGVVYRRTATDLSATVEQVMERYAFRIEEAGLRLELSLPDDLPSVAHAPNGVTQILLNLLDNAIKYGASGGVVRVSVRQIGERVELAVTDRGSGPAFTEEQNGGSGLGLPLVEQIAQLHHARFRIVSSADGTVASVAFPIGEPES